MKKYHHINKENYGEWALVTGAGSGVGREFAKLIAQKGINVILVARGKEALEATAKQIEENDGVETKVIAVDLAKEDAIMQIISQTEGLEVGLLINSAGYALSGDFTEHSADVENDLLDVNVRAPMLLSLHFAKQMKARGRGGIVFLSSIMAFGAAAGWASYNASKAHNLLLAEGIGEELKPYGINVIALTPGSIDTGFGARSHTKVMNGALKPKRVAKCGLRMLACGRRTHTAGVMNKLIAFATRLNPRVLNTKIFSAVVRQLSDTKDQS